jgi:hypothetical protein
MGRFLCTLQSWSYKSDGLVFLEMYAERHLLYLIIGNDSLRQMVFCFFCFVKFSLDHMLTAWRVSKKTVGYDRLIFGLDLRLKGRFDCATTFHNWHAVAEGNASKFWR